MSESGIAESTDGVRLAWSRTGTGPALVVIDPILVDRTLSPNNTLVEHLTNRFTVIRYDRRGKGDSTDKEAYAPAREVEDLQVVMDAAGNGEEAFVYGFSSGGSLALYAASRGVGIQSVVVMEPPSDIPGTEEFIAEAEELIGQGLRVDAVRRFYRYQGMPDDVVEQMAPFAKACARYAHTISNDLRIADELTSDALARITVPTLAVVSKASPPPLHDFVARVTDHVTTSKPAELDGDWHGVSDELLADTIADFFLSNRR